MIVTIYIIILTYFIIGGAGFYFINRRKDRVEAGRNRTKYITYFFIINVIFLSIALKPQLFHYLGLAIMVAGVGELVKLFRTSGFRNSTFFFLFLVLYLFLCAGFYRYSLMDRNLVLFTFLVLSVFDAFSQISGQLLGKTRIFPSVSPQKTLEGLAGGVLVALATSVLMIQLVPYQAYKSILLGAGIVLFAFIGDTATSVYKRKYGVKDFSNLIPGHGGVLDRFDSLLSGGAFVALADLAGFLQVY